MKISGDYDGSGDVYLLGKHTVNLFQFDTGVKRDGVLNFCVVIKMPIVFVLLQMFIRCSRY